MAWLFIDSAKPDTFRFGVLDEKGKGVRSNVGRSHALLTAIARHVPRRSLDRVQGICVVQGPGSFTAVRTGVLVANILSRQLQKPLVAVSSEQAEDLASLATLLATGSLMPSATVLPVYDAEPNITVKTC